MKIITTAVIKGGTGKTTTAWALSQAAAHVGHKVLAVDLDPQCNLSTMCGADTSQDGAYSLITGEAEAQSVIQKTPVGIDMIPASPDLAAIKTSTGSAGRLARGLEPIKGDYDFIFLDTPPMLCEMQYNAIAAADGLIIPIEADTSSIQGLYQITDLTAQIQRVHPVQVLGIVVTRYDPRPRINRYLVGEIARRGAEVGAPLLSAIRSGVSVKEAQAMHQPLYEYAPKSKPALDYMDLFKIITGKQEADKEWLRKILQE